MKTIEQLAREAGFVDYELEDYTESGLDVRYARFAALVAERCAALAHKAVSAQHAEDLILAEFPKP